MYYQLQLLGVKHSGSVCAPPGTGEVVDDGEGLVQVLEGDRYVEQ